MNIEKTNNLSFYNEQGILTLTAKQFDTGRMFVFHIMHNDAPFDLSGCTAYLRIAKADGTQFQGHECCTIEGSKVIIKTNIGNGSQILTAAGTNVCELHLEDSDGTSLTTWTFHIVVEPRVHDGSNMSSINSYDVLDNMINMEKERIANEKQRLENELQRKENETNRNTVFEQKLDETNSVITDCRLVIDTANQKINNFDAEINEIVDGITNEAQSYADNAKASETNAANAASSATDSAAIASQKAGDAAASAVLSQSYAIGGTGSRESEDADNAKEYAKQAKASADELRNGYILKTEKGVSEGVATLDSNGKIPEEQLPDNIGSVTGVKGDKENAYRTGNVNITPENVGALSLKGGTVNGKVTINDTFTVNKSVSTETSEQAVTEFMVERNKVKINSRAENGAVHALALFNGSPGSGRIDLDGILRLYDGIDFRQDRAQISYEELILSGSHIRITDKYGDGIHVGGGDVDIGSISSDGERLEIQTERGGGSRTRLRSTDFKIGRTGDIFLEYYRDSSRGNRCKLRYGTRGSNIKCDYDSFSMWANDNGIQIYNENSVMGDIHLSRNDGTSLFSTDIILQGNTEHKADLYLETGYIFGERAKPYNHAIKIGHAHDDVMRFYEVGRRWEFCNGTGEQCITLWGNRIMSGDEIMNLELISGHGISIRENAIFHNGSDTYSLGTLGSPFSDLYLGGDSGIGPRINIEGGGYHTTFFPAEWSIYSSSGRILISTHRCNLCSGIFPTQNAIYTIGDSSFKWREVYAANGTIQTSDRNEKNTIEELSSEKAQQLIYGLKPSTYKMNAGTSGRTHWGMISQDIEEMFEEIGMTSLDFAGFIKSPKMTEEVRDEETGKIIKESKVIEGEYNYSLRYDEFIAPIIKVIQTQHEELEALKQKIELLERQAQINSMR